MPLSFVALLAFLGCVSITAGPAFAELDGQKRIVTIENFNQSSDPVEPTEDGVEPEGGSCAECYPPPK
jgi:hypothetical protein